MKICTRCLKSKSIDVFPKNSRNKDGHATWCTPCFTEQARIKRQSDPKERERKSRNRRAGFLRNQEKMLSYLENHPCVDCGEERKVLLDFDHRDMTTKSYNISEMMWRCKWDTILKEIEKCDVRCVVCHRVRTADQLGWWKKV